MNIDHWTGAKVLVTGGASFIGSHLVDRLVELGADVRVADDLSSGRLENLACSRERVDFREGDLRDREFTRTVIAGRHVVFHLAACHGGRGCIDSHPAECASNMVLDGMVFDEALKAGVEKVAFASSACVPDAPARGTHQRWRHLPERRMGRPVQGGRRRR
jgi:UDP-glucose 4-epimerase